MGGRMKKMILKAGVRERQVAVGLLVLGLHLLAIMAWWSTQYHLPALPISASASPISVWLEDLPRMLVLPNKPPQAHTPAAPHSVSPNLDPSNQATGATTSPSQDGAASLSQPADPAGVPTPLTPGSALNLNLSQKDAALLATPGFAAQSPFHGRMPATVERAIANAAAQSGPWTEERVDYDHIRFRCGNTCIMMERPRVAALDPFSDASARTPWKASLTDC